MSEINTGGPAFPFGTAFAGMTLRDYFAAKAMQGLLAKHGFHDNEQQFAVWCYETADAMIQARGESK